MPFCNKCNKDKLEEDFKKKADGTFLKRCKACNQLAAEVNKKLKEKKASEQQEAKTNPEEPSPRTEPVEIKKKEESEDNIERGVNDDNCDESSDSDDESVGIDENDLANGLAITYEYVLSRLIEDGYLIKK